MAKQTKPDKLSIKQVQHKIRRAEILGSVAIALIRYGGLVACVFFVMRAVQSLAGQHTVADIGFTGKLQISTA
ncbi:MAG TPA: hypothetical protein VN651_20075, partial [Gemmatimonadaceae bacterium]|nr:hypothetical protein [Gemmatimonadaceae bacterium]